MIATITGARVWQRARLAASRVDTCVRAGAGRHRRRPLAWLPRSDFSSATVAVPASTSSLLWLTSDGPSGGEVVAAFGRKGGAPVQLPAAAVHTAGAEPVRQQALADGPGSGSVLALSRLEQRCCSTSVSDTGGPCRRGACGSAGQMQRSPRAPRQRCCSSQASASSGGDPAVATPCRAALGRRDLASAVVTARGAPARA